MHLECLRNSPGRCPASPHQADDSDDDMEIVIVGSPDNQDIISEILIPMIAAHLPL